MADIPIKNPNEVNNYRNKVVWNHTAGAVTFENSTGREYIQIAHRSGSNLTFANQATSEFNPNNKQTTTLGNTFETTKGNRHMLAQELEQRVYGDVTILTGDSKLFNSPLLDSYILELNTLAAAKGSPELMQPGFGNVTGAIYEAKGDSPDPETGSTEGKFFEPNPLQANIQSIYKETQKKLTPYEKLMGNGGNIKLLSGKDILIKAGAAVTNFDTLFINPNGRAVNDKLVYDGDVTITSKLKSAPYFEEKDVASNIPFGNLHIEACNKLDFNSAAGGITFGTSGPIRLSGQAITTIQGAQVNITGGAGGGATGHIFIKSGDLIEIVGSNVNLKSGTDVFIEPGLSVLGDQTISGNLVIGGNLTVLGNIVCKGTIHANKNITSDVDVIAAGISLVNHTHPSAPSGPASKPQ